MSDDAEVTERSAPLFEIVGPHGGSLGQLSAERPLQPFSDVARSFLSALSAELLRRPTAQAFPELAALGYWMRPASVERLLRRYTETTAILAARGITFHIAPSNVDTIFVYSWLLSMIAGNANIVRLSRKATPQSEALVSILLNLLDDAAFVEIRNRTLLVRYEPDPITNAHFSAVAGVRVVWGGDVTVAEMRKVPLPALASEVVFGDRFSLAVIDAGRWVRADLPTRERLVAAFVNDTYWFMQMACSSPRMVTWIGLSETVEAARTDFWGMVRLELSRRTNIIWSNRDFMDKRVAVAEVAISTDVRVEAEPDAVLVRLWMESPSLAQRELHCGAGMFWECAVPDLQSMTWLGDRRVQTVSHFGFTEEQLRTFLASQRPLGGDRWVPFGQALDFSHVWDGFDLIRTFTRELVVIPSVSSGEHSVAP